MDREGTCQSLLVENADLKQRLLEMQAKLDDKEELQDKLHYVKVDKGLEEEELDVDTPLYAEVWLGCQEVCRCRWRQDMCLCMDLGWLEGFAEWGT